MSFSEPPKPAPESPSDAAGVARPEGQLVVDAYANLKAAPELVFEFVTDVSKIPEFMPVIIKAESDDSQAQTPGGKGSVRVIRTPVGPPTLETVVNLDKDNMLYAYSAADKNLFGMMRDHTGVITCEADGEGGTHFRWLAYAKPGVWPMGAVGRLVFGTMLKKSTRKLERIFNA